MSKKKSVRMTEEEFYEAPLQEENKEKEVLKKEIKRLSRIVTKEDVSKKYKRIISQTISNLMDLL